MKKSELLKTEHDVQLKWLSNQIAKIANDGALAFKNTKTSERSFNRMLKDNIGVPSNSEIEHFVSVHLSETGIRKLVTTLRVYLKRSGAERLQVELTKSNKQLLDKLVDVSGKTKIEIINQLIGNALISDFKRPEEQLEIVTL
ncbi:hypothetical protein [Psychromonas antarctica]|uniref:hypothetical protein n=1 Tax=Psychromonas antarctica TaxID=67573 RepID=UPI001EE7B51C|nr:hypothetical protein [Psychromonas antarctica]MCG6202038.1 hypothetical protein [Psychromonas antarctica]